jgi:hypothetical protein
MVLAVGTRIDAPEAGASTTNGTTGREITFANELATADYHVSISFEANPSGGAGEWWIGAKLTTGFTLYHNGVSGLAFTYAVTRY